MQLLEQLWKDQSGAILSAEAVTVGTITVVGATVGLKMAAEAVNAEFSDMSQAFRGLDQSYSVEGNKSERAWTASSGYSQPKLNSPDLISGDVKTETILAVPKKSVEQEDDQVLKIKPQTPIQPKSKFAEESL
jgi:hypothetical protein